ncbi:MAG TPA: flagellar hook capping FlgD N-terminal domain-containing protein [Allosphingosinicella sp.]|nr:flagellar hook capping FlgD N-terminal domain-containing protein [Allosphingosinicella sp.]
MALAPVSATNQANSAFGLDFQSLLRIILTQLTYQDPLKPMDNFQFVSQLAQFSQLQQSQSLNDQITNLLAAQAAMQGTSLLGRTVDFTNSTGVIASGLVKAVSFASGGPQVTVQTAAGETIANIAIANITQVR